MDLPWGVRRTPTPYVEGHVRGSGDTFGGVGENARPDGRSEMTRRRTSGHVTPAFDPAPWSGPWTARFPALAWLVVAGATLGEPEP